MVDDLVDHLNAQGYSADRLHGDMTQMMRDRVMQKFRKSGLEFLVATDVAARGIDVDDVQVVFNYDLPYDGEDYVHRIGRTGRKGREGRAISFASGREVFQIRNIERYTNMRIQRGRVPTVNEVSEARANVFLDKLRITLKGGEYKRHDHLIERLLEEGFASTDIASALIHHLQGGDAAPAKPAPREEERPRAERPPNREVREDGRERGYDRREERPARPPLAERRAPEPTRPRPAERAVAPSPTPAVSAKPPVTAPPISKPARPDKPAAVVTPAPQPVPFKTKAAMRAEQAASALAPVPVAAAETGLPVEAKPAAEKTYSDKEILASVKNPSPLPPKAPGSKSVPPWQARKLIESKPPPGPKVSRATPPNQTRLWMNLGEEMAIKPIDIVNAVAGETGLPGKVVGTVDVRERHLFVDVAAEHANSIIAKLNRAQIKGHKVKVKAA
jgi:ATP-dependent RNA helicase DeaD